MVLLNKRYILLIYNFDLMLQGILQSLNFKLEIYKKNFYDFL